MTALSTIGGIEDTTSPYPGTSRREGATCSMTSGQILPSCDNPHFLSYLIWTICRWVVPVGGSIEGLFSFLQLHLLHECVWTSPVVKAMDEDWELAGNGGQIIHRLGPDIVSHDKNKKAESVLFVCVSCVSLGPFPREPLLWQASIENSVNDRCNCEVACQNILQRAIQYVFLMLWNHKEQQ